MKQAPVLADRDIKQLLGYLATTGYHPALYADAELADRHAGGRTGFAEDGRRSHAGRRCPDCQRRSKIGPCGGVKVDHLAHGERCRQEG